MKKIIAVIFLSVFFLGGCASTYRGGSNYGGQYPIRFHTGDSGTVISGGGMTIFFPKNGGDIRIDIEGGF